MKWIVALVVVLLNVPCLMAENDAADSRALSRLKLAQSLHLAGKIESAKAWYADIIKNWPDTEAAQEARRLLNGEASPSQPDYVSAVGVLHVGPSVRFLPTPAGQSTPSRVGSSAATETGAIIPASPSGNPFAPSRLPALNVRPSIRIQGDSNDRVAPAVALGSLLPQSTGLVQVRGYWRKDGTYVRPHTRSMPRR